MRRWSIYPSGMWKLTKSGAASESARSASLPTNSSRRKSETHTRSLRWRETRKLVLTHYVGKRTAASTEHFIAKLAHVTSRHPYQLSTDGFPPYVTAVKKYLSGRVHFAQIIKVYSSPREGQQRYSPGEVVGGPSQDHGKSEVRSHLHQPHRGKTCRSEWA